MDHLRFDALTVAWAQGTTRRAAVRRVSLAGLTALLGVVSPDRHLADVAARGRPAHAQHADRHAVRTEKCIPNGERCPQKKHGKHGKKLSCAHCCAGTSFVDAVGHRICGCVPNGGGCTSTTAASCCSGVCDGAVCQAATCSATTACPACQTCSAGTCVTATNGTACAGGNTCCNGMCCSGCCGTDGACGTCRVFATSTLQQGNFGGLGAADALCQTLANSARPTPLPGTYKAWLSDSTASPSTRFRCTAASCSAQGYTLVNGTQVAANWDALTSGTLDAAIAVTEKNTAAASSVAWTHTLRDGTAGGSGNDHCLNWTSKEITDNGDDGLADITVTDVRWTNFNSQACSQPFLLYCFQQD